MAKAKAKTYKGKSLKLGGGSRFAKLKSSVASGYMKKGVSAAKAKKIGGAVAAKIGRKKLGKSKFQALASKGKKRVSSKSYRGIPVSKMYAKK